MAIRRSCCAIRPSARRRSRLHTPGYIWIVSRDGGAARRLVTGYDLASGPHFSPDGSMIAFTANYDGNADVYVVRRAAANRVGSPIMAATPRWAGLPTVRACSSSRIATATPIPIISTRFRFAATPSRPSFRSRWRSTARYSPDGTHLAYVPSFQWEPFWKGYRGGQTTPIWIANLADSSVVNVPRQDSNDNDPMWVGDTRLLPLRSRRTGNALLVRYAHRRGNARAPALGLRHHLGIGRRGCHRLRAVRHLPSLRHCVAFDPNDPRHDGRRSRAGSAALAEGRRSNSRMRTSRPAACARSSKRTARSSPCRRSTATFATLPTLPGTANRDPAWSPDGRWIAYFSDASGEYTLRLKDQKGLQPPPSYRSRTVAVVLLRADVVAG